MGQQVPFVQLFTVLGEDTADHQAGFHRAARYFRLRAFLAAGFGGASQANGGFGNPLSVCSALVSDLTGSLKR